MTPPPNYLNNSAKNRKQATEKVEHSFRDLMGRLRASKEYHAELLKEDTTGWGRQRLVDYREEIESSQNWIDETTTFLKEMAN